MAARIPSHGRREHWKDHVPPNGNVYGKLNGTDYGKRNGADYGKRNGADYVPAYETDYGKRNGTVYGKRNGADYVSDYGTNYGILGGTDYGKLNGTDYGKLDGTGYGKLNGTDHLESFAGAENCPVCQSKLRNPVTLPCGHLLRPALQEQMLHDCHVVYDHGGGEGRRGNGKREYSLQNFLSQYNVQLLQKSSFNYMGVFDSEFCSTCRLVVSVSDKRHSKHERTDLPTAQHNIETKFSSRLAAAKKDATKSSDQLSFWNEKEETLLSEISEAAQAARDQLYREERFLRQEVKQIVKDKKLQIEANKKEKEIQLLRLESLNAKIDRKEDLMSQLEALQRFEEVLPKEGMEETRVEEVLNDLRFESKELNNISLGNVYQNKGKPWEQTAITSTGPVDQKSAWQCHNVQKMKEKDEVSGNRKVRVERDRKFAEANQRMTQKNQASKFPGINGMSQKISKETLKEISKETSNEISKETSLSTSLPVEFELSKTSSSREPSPLSLLPQAQTENVAFSQGRPDSSSDHIARDAASSAESHQLNDPESFLMKFSLRGRADVLVYNADLCKHKCDAVVNASNEQLVHGGGLAAALSRAAGPELQRASTALVQASGNVRICHAMVTDGFNLPCKFVIHAVGPDFRSIRNLKECKYMLFETFIKALEVADEKNCRSVAIPALSSGNFGMEKAVVAKVLAKALTHFEHKLLHSRVQEIHLVNLEDTMTEIIIKTLYNRFYLESTEYAQSFIVKREANKIIDCRIKEEKEPKIMLKKFASPAPVNPTPTPRRSSVSMKSSSHANDMPFNDPDSFLMKFSLAGRANVFVYNADLCKYRCDAIVNAANERLKHDGGLAGALSRTAGPELQRASDELVRSGGVVQTGDAVATSGYELPCKFVIHAVGPDHRVITSLEKCKKLLKQALCRTFEVSSELQCRQVAIPALSSGIFEMPIVVVAEVIAEALEWFEFEIIQSTIQEIHLVNLEKEVSATIMDVLKQRFYKKLAGYKHSFMVKPEAEAIISDWKERNRKREEEGAAGVPLRRSSFRRSSRSSRSSQRTTQRSQSEATPNDGADGADGAVCVQRSSPAKRDSHGRARKESEKCAICLDEISKKTTQLKCGHEFCKDCIDGHIRAKRGKICPICREISGSLSGDQPMDGQMTYCQVSGSLPGSAGHGHWKISYVFPSGIQKSYHPHPGRHYEGTRRNAYLPDNEKGRRVLKLLEKAWKQRLVFTIGVSGTSGVEGIVWNDIHHKTNPTGGTSNYGYPDAGYLDRVLGELKCRGIE